MRLACYLIHFAAAVGGVLLLAAGASAQGYPQRLPQVESGAVLRQPVRVAKVAQPSLQSPKSPRPQPLPSAEASPGELQPRVGEVFMEPPPIPAVPQGLLALETADEALQATEPLTLEALEALACQNNPTLLQARAEVQGALGKAIQAGLWPNPVFIYAQDQIGVNNTPGEFLGGLVQQEIVTAHKLDLSRAKFLARTKTAQWLALAQEYRVLNDVRMHYFRARARQDLVEVQRELLKNAEDAAVTARELYNLGQATRAEVHQANVAIQQQRLKLLAAENQFQEAFREMTALAGIDLPSAKLAGPLEGPVQPIDWDQALERLMTQSPEVQAAVAKLRADEITIRREIAEPVPNIVVQGGAGRNFVARETTGMLEVMAEIPLYDWNQGAIRQAEADYARQQGEVRRTRLTLRRELARVYRRYLTALQHVRSYQEVIVPEARRAYEVLLDSYEDDRVAWPVVLEAERDYFQLRGEYIMNLMAWREAEVLIVGFLLHNGLEPAPNPTPPGHINATPKPR